MIKTIGKYKLEAEIGHGGFGRVYRAYDPATRRTVAIKILISEKHNKDVLARFRREATATASLKHKNIVIVYDYGEHEDTPYLVMEYLEGEDLKSALSSGHKFTLLEKTSIISQLADGLHYAHQCGIIHRDIKPANLMILADGTVKIMDFGIALVLNEMTTRLTRHGDVIGTLSYLAPEVFQGSEVDQRCDVFSCGAICYEMIAGKHPFAADEPARIIYNITSLQPPPVTTFAPDCPIALEQLITRALQKDRELRYQSIEDLLFDLLPIRMQLQSVEAQNLLHKAEGLVLARQVREAQSLVRQVLQLDPNNTTARELRERVNREIQQQGTRDRCDQLIVKGTEELNSSDYQKAKQTLESALALVPDNVQAQNLLEQVKGVIKKRERADALIARAKAELEADQLTDAYRSILECFQFAPDDKEATRLMETIRTAIKARERQRRLAEGLAKAEELIKNDQPEDAESIISDLELSYPAEPKVKQLMNKAASLIAEKRRRQELLHDLARVRRMLSEKKWAEARDSLGVILLDFPGEQEAQSLSVYAEEQLQLQRKAEQVDQIVREARTANDGRDFERALSLLNEGLRKYPGESSLERMLSRTTELQRDYQRQIAIRAATERATELAANNDFAGALGVIDLTAATWGSGEFQELRSQLEKRQEAFERAQAIAKTIATVKRHLERRQFEEAVQAGRQALSEFPEQPELKVLLGTAEQRLTQQRREARIKAIRDQATTNAAQGLFEDALEVLRSGISELGGEPSLSELQERIQGQLQEQQRQQATSALAASLREIISKGDYEAAVRAGQAGLRKFPGERLLTDLLETAQRSLLQQQRAEKIAKIKQEALSLVSAQKFQPALKLIRSAVQELGPDPSLQELDRSVETQRQKYERELAIKATVDRATQMLASKDCSGAVALLEEFLKQNPGEARIQNLLTDARDQLSQQLRSKAISEILKKARGLVQAREFQSALNIVRSGLQEYPDEDSLSEMAAQIKADMQEAEKQRAIRAALETTASLRERREFTKAAQLLEQALVKAPDHPELLQQLSAIKEKIATQQKVNVVLDEVFELMSRGAFDVALERVHHALATFPGELALSSLLEEVKKAKRSQAILDLCQQIEARRSAGNLPSAIQLCDSGLAEFPGDSTLLALQNRIRTEVAEVQKRQTVTVLTAEIQRLLGEQRVDDAVAKLQKALREFPGEPELTGLLAYSNEILAARRRTDAVNELARKAKTLIRNGKAREAVKLLKDALQQYPDEEALVPLLARAQETASQVQETPVIEPVATPVSTRGNETTHEREEVPRPQETHQNGSGEVRRSEKPVHSYRALIWLGVLLAVGLAGWAAWSLYPHKTKYQQQFEVANSYFQQKEFGKAIDALQQIPSESPFYKQAQDFLVTAREAEKRRNVDALLAQLTEQRKQNQDTQALETITKILDLDPSNKVAISVRADIEKTKTEAFERKPQEEQDQYVKETLATAQQLFTDGSLEEAQAKVNEVVGLRPNDRTARNLARAISNQIEAVKKVASEHRLSDEAKESADKAGASDQPEYVRALRVVETARGFETAKRFDQAFKNYATAADLFRTAENAAKENATRTATAQLQQRNLAEAARRDYAQNRDKAHGLDAETKAANRFQAAVAQGNDAQNKLDKGDFAGARAGFDTASKGMAQAADDAKLVADNQAAAQLTLQQQKEQQQQQRTAMETAQKDMETAKRGFSGTDATALGEETRARQLASEGKFADAIAAYQRATTYWRDDVKNAAQLENDRQAIRAVLGQYRNAYQAKDMPGIRKVFSGIGGTEETETTKMFNFSKSIQLSLDPKNNEIQITGDTARVVTEGGLHIVTKTDNQNQNIVIRFTFTLRKTNGSWSIQGISR